MAAKKRLSLKEKNKKFWFDFKAFATRGNVMDVAVGIIIGAAFSSIVTSLVNILLSLCTWGLPGGISGLVTVLPAANDGSGAVFATVARNRTVFAGQHRFFQKTKSSGRLERFR